MGTHLDQTLGRRVTFDSHRPSYHFLPPANWMNDPNGLIDWQGRYHLYYQYNPFGARWGNIHWGHASSDDLVHWTHHPIALEPSADGPDANGCWSGCAVVDAAGVPTILYTGLRNGLQRPCLATSGGALLLEWERYAANPVIPEPPQELDLVGFRDHTIWQEDGDWFMGIGAGVRGAGGAVLLYRSNDLRHWEYEGLLASAETEYFGALWTGAMWECPNFFWLHDRPFLVFSAWEEGRTAYSVVATGSYVDRRFTMEQASRLDYGDHHFYAPQVMTDRHGRRLMWGWIQEGRSLEAQDAAGWSGAMSLPRQLLLNPAGVLEIHPVPELRSLREKHHQAVAHSVPPGTVEVLAGGAHLEIEAVFARPRAGMCGLSLRRSPDGEEETLLMYDAGDQILVLDRRRASRDPEATADIQSGPLMLAEDEPLRLHLFIDASVVEVFANDRTCLTSRVYPTRSDATRVAMFAEGTDAQLLSFDAWEIASIW